MSAEGFQIVAYHLAAWLNSTEETVWPSLRTNVDSTAYTCYSIRMQIQRTAYMVEIVPMELEALPPEFALLLKASC